MQYIKRLLRAKSSHLSQIVRRLSEIEYSSTVTFKKENEKIKLSNKISDNCFLTNEGDICCITHVNDDSNIIVRIFDKKKKCKFYPFSSKLLDIYACSELDKVKTIRLMDIKQKMFRMPFKNRYICIPLCNSD